MIYYITDENGDVCAQFDGVSVELLDAHDKNEVDSIEDLPGIDYWNDNY